MATLSIQSITPAGLNPSYVAANGGGDKVKPGDRTFFHIKNDGGASVTVTLDDAGSVSPVGATSFDPDVEVVVEPGGSRFIGPLVENRFRGSDGLAAFTYSGVTSVTVAALRA